MNIGKKILKNSFYLVTSTIITNIIAAATGILIVRYLGKISYGYYSTASTFASTFVMLTYSGVNTYILKVGNKDKKQQGIAIGNSLVIQLVLIVIVYFVAIIYLRYINYQDITKQLSNITIISTLISTLSLPLGAVLQANDKYLRISLINIISSIISSINIILTIIFKFTLYFYVNLALLQSILMIFIYIIFSKEVIKNISFDFKQLIKEVKVAYLFGLSAMLYTVYYSIDSFMLSIMKCETDVGLYQSAYKVFAILLIISSILSNVIEPVMFNLYKSSKKESFLLSDRLLKYICVLGICISFGLFSISNQVINLLYGDQFQEAGIILAILSFAIMFRYGATMIGFLLTVSSAIKYKVNIQLITSIQNIVLNIILIPKYSYYGAAIATVISEFTIFVLYSVKINKSFYKIKVFSKVTKPILISLIMAFSILIAQKYFNCNIFTNILLGFIIYLSMCILLKVISLNELKGLKLILRKENNC